MVLLAVTIISRQTVRPAGSIAGSRSAATDPQPWSRPRGSHRSSPRGSRRNRPARARRCRSRGDGPLPTRVRCPGWGARARPESSDEAAEAQRGVAVFLSGAPAGLPGEPIPAMPAPPPILFWRSCPCRSPWPALCRKPRDAAGSAGSPIPRESSPTSRRMEASAHEQAARRRLRYLLRHRLRLDGSIPDPPTPSRPAADPPCNRARRREFKTRPRRPRPRQLRRGLRSLPPPATCWRRW